MHAIRVPVTVVVHLEHLVGLETMEVVSLTVNKEALRSWDVVCMGCWSLMWSWTLHARLFRGFWSYISSYLRQWLLEVWLLQFIKVPRLILFKMFNHLHSPYCSKYIFFYFYFFFHIALFPYFHIEHKIYLTVMFILWSQKYCIWNF